MSTTEDAAIRSKARSIFGALPALGVWLDIPSVVTADIIARTGFDFGIVDLEHGPSSYETAMAQILAFDAQKRPILLRPPLAADPWIKRGLGLGAAGVIAPAVENAEMARSVVRAVRYGPSGGRGVATRLVRAADYGADDSYEPSWNDRALTIVQIESPAALAEAPAIAAVDGVDGLFFGPADFSAAAGYPGAAALGDAFLQMAEAAKARGKLVCSVTFPGYDSATLQAAGADIIPVGSDVALLRQSAESVVTAARV